MPKLERKTSWGACVLQKDSGCSVVFSLLLQGRNQWRDLIQEAGRPFSVAPPPPLRCLLPGQRWPAFQNGSHTCIAYIEIF